MATIKVFGNLRQMMVAPQFEMQAETVHGLLTMLCAENGAFDEAVMDDGVLRPFIKITINGKDIRLGDGLDTAIACADTIAVFPPIAGG